jgi:hypothetical protein
MEKEFIPYEQALALKELGFDEPCFGTYLSSFQSDWKVYELILEMGITEEFEDNRNVYLLEEACSAPTFSQAFRWFREKYDLNSLVVFDKYICEIDDEELENPYFTYYYSINELWSEGKDYGKFTRGFINVASNRDMLSYEESELACLIKLIEIVKNKL